jgi:hypothetical protein
MRLWLASGEGKEGAASPPARILTNLPSPELVVLPCDADRRDLEDLSTETLSGCDALVLKGRVRRDGRELLPVAREAVRAGVPVLLVHGWHLLAWDRDLHPLASMAEPVSPGWPGILGRQLEGSLAERRAWLFAQERNRR